MNYPKLGQYQGGGMRKRRARKLKQRFDYLDRELGRDALKPTEYTDKAKRAQRLAGTFNMDTEYNRKIKAGMARVKRGQRINEAASDLAKARKRKRVNRQFKGMRDELKQDVKTAKQSLKSSRKSTYGKRKMRREMVKTGKDANLQKRFPKGVVAAKRISSDDEYQNYGKMRGGRAGFRGKARTKKVR